MMVPGIRYRGGTIRLTIVITDASGELISPDEMTCTVMSPTYDVQTYTIGNDTEIVPVGEGSYSCDVKPDKSGLWHFRWVATGDLYTMVHEGTFNTQASVPLDGIGGFVGGRYEAYRT